MPKRTTQRTTDHRGALRQRIERALREGRSMQALDLAKTLCLQEASPANHDLLKQAYLARGRELRERGATADSITTLKTAATLSDDPAWLAKVIQELVLSGGIREIIGLLPRLTDPSARDLVLGHIADAAIQQGPSERAFLPEEHHADCDRIVQAFALSENGQDEEARTVLGAIGLRSPFLEWKLLLRGLLAYYANEDARALENWQRLNPERLPARLAAPLRQSIDAAYRAAQAPATQTQMQQQLDKIQGRPLTSRIRELRAALADKENLAPAFRLAEALLPELRRTRPALVERLGRVFYWTITDSSPDDVPRYQRVFGRPASDPNFNRLHALAYDRAGEFHRSHAYWQKVEKEIGSDPSRWPDGQAARARALVWLHMGRNAALIPAADKQAKLPFFLREAVRSRRPVKPSAEECFDRAADLAPDLLEPYEALFDHYRLADMIGKAEEAARRLLKQFPDHAPTLEALGDICSGEDEQDEALSLYKRALRANPLERRLRAKVAAAHLGCARLRAVYKDFDRARQEVQAAQALRGVDSVLLCREAAIELKAGNDARAEELLARTRQSGGTALGTSFRMMYEVARLKLPKRYKTRFEAEFATACAEPPTGAAALEIARAAAGIAFAPKYPGQKAHEKKALSYLERAKNADFTETELQETSQALVRLHSIRLARHYLDRGLEEFRRNPFFPYFMALSFFQQRNSDEPPAWRTRDFLEKAEKLARKLPQTDELTRMLDDIAMRFKILDAFDPFANLGSLFGGGGFYEPDPDFMDDEDDKYDEYED